MMMKYSTAKFLGLITLVVSLMMISCTEDATSFDSVAIEKEIFNSWMEKYHTDLYENNYQEDGGYYIDITTVGDTSGLPLRDSAVWIKYEMTGYDLHGNVSITRNDVVAWQQGSYSDYTHYVPYYRMSSPEYDKKKDGDLVLECTQLAFMNALKIGNDDNVLLYNGAEFTLYSPSSITSKDGVTGTGGYEGQYALSTMPFICDIKVTNVIHNPVTYDNELVNTFASVNGGLTVTSGSFDNVHDDKEDTDADKETEGDDTEDDDDTTTPSEPQDPNAWTNASSNIANVYINKKFELNFSGASFNYIDTYTSTVPTSPYANGMAALDAKINTILEERFSSEYDAEGELVGEEGTAKVWYICRLLDGFIIDTNIAKVKDLIYNTSESTGSVISYNAEEDGESYVSAWLYSIPNLHYGNWGAIVTSSTYAYGASGVNGDTTTSSSSSSSAYDYYNYYNYYNYYSGYNSYYNNDYYGNNYYGNNYYDYSSNYYNNSTTTTTTKISTEILPYSALIFQIFIEADDSDK